MHLSSFHFLWEFGLECIAKPINHCALALLSLGIQVFGVFIYKHLQGVLRVGFSQHKTLLTPLLHNVVVECLVICLVDGVVHSKGTISWYGMFFFYYSTFSFEVGLVGLVYYETLFGIVLQINVEFNYLYLFLGLVVSQWPRALSGSRWLIAYSSHQSLIVVLQTSVDCFLFCVVGVVEFFQKFLYLVVFNDGAFDLTQEALFWDTFLPS